MTRIDIGFIEECETWKLSSRFFPSKVGGKPAWLDLRNIPRKENVECQFCGQPCIFLCQIYAPYEEDPKAFHRTIFVFVCKNPDCCKPNANGNLRVIRSQLERHNEFYPSDPPVEKKGWRQDINTDKWTKACNVCGIYAPSLCSKCRKIYYCSREHQVFDWKHGHKTMCGSTYERGENSFLFPEFELVTEIEEDSSPPSESDDADVDESEMQKYENLKSNNQAGTLQDEPNVDNDLLQMSAVNDDEDFFEFSRKVKIHPDQILRYDRGGSVLYISSQNKTAQVPNCEHCGNERQFEFQIMPQLLNYLRFEDTLKSLDWGILAVYTCKRSCVPKSGYVAEYIWKQDIVENKK